MFKKTADLAEVGSPYHPDHCPADQHHHDDDDDDDDDDEEDDDDDDDDDDEEDEDHHYQGLMQIEWIGIMVGLLL